MRSKSLAIYDPILLSVVRIVSNKKLAKNAASVEDALAYVDIIRHQASTNISHPGPGHWDLYKDLLKLTGHRHKFITDAYLAALAIENHCTLATNDRDFTRFKTLKVKFIDDLA